MTNTSDSPITVNGVRLDTLAWNINKVNRSTPSRRSTDIVLPGRDGVVQTTLENIDSASFGLEMFVKGTDVDGLIPGGTTQRQRLRDNLDELIHLFLIGQGGAVAQIDEAFPNGSTRRCYAKVLDTMSPDLDMPGGSAGFTVTFTIVSGTWEDPTQVNWTSGILGGTQVVTPMDGATWRDQSAKFLLAGPATAPTITDSASGATIALGRNLSASEQWFLNAATWESRVGTTLTINSLDTAGTDVAALTTFSGLLNQTGMMLTPYRLGGGSTRSVTVATTGHTSATRLTIRARRRYVA